MKKNINLTTCPQCGNKNAEMCVAWIICEKCGQSTGVFSKVVKQIKTSR